MTGLCAFQRRLLRYLSRRYGRDAANPVCAEGSAVLAMRATVECEERIRQPLKGTRGNFIVEALGVSVVWSTMPHMEGCDTSACEDARPLSEIAGR